MSLPVRPLHRRRSADDATDLVGEFVEEIPANVRAEGIYVDADSGDPVLAVSSFPGDLAAFRRAVLSIHWNKTYRGSSGIKNTSRTFGMAPRKHMLQRESCRPASLYHEQPDVHEILDRTATELSEWVGSNLPDVDATDRETVEPVLPEWRIGEDTIWTSGVVNLTSQLPYHRDGANFSSWSSMPVVRRGTRGGYLNLPEYDATVACRDGTVVSFPGWRLVHGVTPIRKVEPDGYRITTVYYSLQGMKDCHTFAVETALGREARTRREGSMLRGSEFDPEPIDADGLPV